MKNKTKNKEVELPIKNYQNILHNGFRDISTKHAPDVYKINLEYKKYLKKQQNGILDKYLDTKMDTKVLTVLMNMLQDAYTFHVKLVTDIR